MTGKGRLHLSALVFVLTTMRPDLADAALNIVNRINLHPAGAGASLSQP
ncbi:MAG: hypothetical protein ACP5R5_12620 [Armatimonadota bacterium]